MPDLEVHLYETHVGDLVGNTWRDFDFVAARSAIERFGVGSTVLSESVPLVPQQARGKAARRRAFFDELLPEGAARQRLAERARVAAPDTLGLLAAYGRDVAGRAGDVVDRAVATIRSTVQQEEPHARAVPGLRERIDALAARIGEPAPRP